MLSCSPDPTTNSETIFLTNQTKEQKLILIGKKCCEILIRNLLLDPVSCLDIFVTAMADAVKAA